jgi:hypothetical protein
MVTMNFQVFQRRIPQRISDQPTATITMPGYISLNRAAHIALGEPVAVELLFDRAEHIMGLRPVPVETPHAFPVRPQGGKRGGPVIVSAQAFTRHYGIRQAVSRRWSAYVDDGVLCIDLKQAGRVVTSNRARPS